MSKEPYAIMVNKQGGKNYLMSFKSLEVHEGVTDEDEIFTMLHAFDKENLFVKTLTRFYISNLAICF